MFYLGASANILTYFLVSAFFVVCLYTQDRICLSEFLGYCQYEEAAEIDESSLVTGVEYKSFYYNEEFEQRFLEHFSLSATLNFIAPPPLLYHNLCCLVQGLRASPIFHF